MIARIPSGVNTQTKIARCLAVLQAFAATSPRFTCANTRSLFRGISDGDSSGVLRQLAERGMIVYVTTIDNRHVYELTQAGKDWKP